MAVTRVVGYADELVIEFTLDSATHFWVAEIPKDMVDGTYVFNCIAYDGAGNYTSSCKMLYTFDSKNLNSRIEKIKYFGVFQESTYFGLFKTNRFFSKVEVLM